MKKYEQLIILFKSTFMLSAFTFGGGYVIVPLLQKKFVEDLKWINEEEMIDLVAIAQSLPGVMAVNASIIIGNKISGIKGALVSCFGTILPPFIILSIVSFFYDWFSNNEYIKIVLTGMQAGVAAIIICAAYTMLKTVLKTNKVSNLIIFFIVLLLTLILKISVIYIILGSIIITTISHFANKKVSV